MNEIIKISRSLVSIYASNALPDKSFARTGYVSNDTSGAADYLALLAYPCSTEDSKRIKFRNALLSAVVIDDYKTHKDIIRRNALIASFQLDKLMIWRDIDRAITGGPNKLGGGVKRLIDRFHSYHVFAAYDKALSDDAHLTHENVLSHISTAYESPRSKLQDAEDRLVNLKKVFRASRPVLHLVYGLVRSFASKGWVNDQGQILHWKQAIYDSSWMNEALEIAEVILGMQLVEHESKLKTGKQLRGHLFDPSEITHIYPFTQK
ncbi:hypothetical protein [Rheinheimera sp.]|uniref:hypothetical protein n=1 Tax=Rheinheimera sp. TaxID=1869214 RepID=UPI003AF61ABD